MLLAVDIGNTSITFGVFSENRLLETFRTASNVKCSVFEYEKIIKNFVKKYDIKDAVISSVCDELSSIIETAVNTAFGINSMFLNHNNNFGIEVITEKPESVGMDRIVNVAAVKAKNLYPAIIVDMGTATTFDITDKDGNFTGGIIMPGINMQLKSLHDNTSKLPIIKIKDIDSVIGNDTETCILSGVLMGHACAIEGLISRTKNELGFNPNVIAAGGYAKIVAKYMSEPFDYIMPNLTLEGMLHIYKINSQPNMKESTSKFLKEVPVD